MMTLKLTDEKLPTICVYHKGCWDGIAAAWVVSRKYPDAKFIPYQYGEPTDILDSYLPTQGNDIRIIIVDFSFPKDDLIRFSGAKEILVLDHHKTAQENCEGLNFCKFDMNESGASLAWKEFYSNIPIPKFISYIKDRDLWLFKELNSEEINAYIQSFDKNLYTCNVLYFELQDTTGLRMAKTAGEAIQRYKNQLVNSVCSNAWLEIIGGYEVPVVNANNLQSEIGHELCKRYKEKSFSASFFTMKDNTRVYSFRSIGDFDVSEVAKKLGGGGHKNAAGFKIKGEGK